MEKNTIPRNDFCSCCKQAGDHPHGTLTSGVYLAEQMIASFEKQSVLHTVHADQAGR